MPLVAVSTLLPRRIQLRVVFIINMAIAHIYEWCMVHFIIDGQWCAVWREFNVMVENLECEAVDLLHDLGSALHLLTLEAQKALKGCFKTCKSL